MDKGSKERSTPASQIAGGGGPDHSGMGAGANRGGGHASYHAIVQLLANTSEASDIVTILGLAKSAGIGIDTLVSPRAPAEGVGHPGDHDHGGAGGHGGR